MPSLRPTPSVAIVPQAAGLGQGDNNM